jgi:hypothetical protein
MVARHEMEGTLRNRLSRLTRLAGRMRALARAPAVRIIRPVPHRALFAGRKLLVRCRTCAGFLAALVVAGSAFAQEERDDRRIPITGDRLSGVVLPIEPLHAPIRFAASRGWSWTIDDTKRLLLQGDVSVSVGPHTFVASEAVVWLNRLPSADGLVNQIAVYFPTLDDPQKRAGLSVAGANVLITGSARGEVSLAVTVLENEPAPASSTLLSAHKRLAEHLRGLGARTPSLATGPQAEAPVPPALPDPVPGGDPFPASPAFAGPATIELPPVDQGPLPIFTPEGRFSFSSESLTIDEQEDLIIAQGGLIIEYHGLDRDGAEMSLLLTAHRGVVFLREGVVAGVRQQMQSFDETQVAGIYLEGDVVATDGSYTLRGQQIYYDLNTKQAIALDAVLRTYARDFNRPVYARAKEMRQISANQWTAEKSTVSMSEFFTPHIALGTGHVTVTKDPEGRAEGGKTRYDAVHNTLRANGMPFFYWPKFSGTTDRLPLRAIQTGYRENDGVRVETIWDFFGLTGLEPQPGIDVTLKLNGYSERGGGVGTDFKYAVGPHNGLVDLYGMYDQGTDKTSGGLEVEPEDELRGAAIAEHTTRLSRYWTLQGQLSAISDDTFVSAWRREDFTDRREFETSLYLKRQRNNTAFDILTKYDLNGFISNDAILASRGYLVDKVPEITYRRYGDSLFADNFTYSSEYRVSRMRLVLPDKTPAEIGVREGAFGIGPDDDISAALRDRGYRTAFVSRADTRHELAYPRTLGIFEFTPYIAARGTAYLDDEFSAFSSDSDEMRLFGSTGLRIRTTFQRIYDGVESRLFDLHRVRHLIEPYAHMWYGYATVADDDLPVYDQDVEPLGATEAIKLGVRNVFQTQRGGPGRWRSVDFLTLDTGLVVNGDDANRRHPVPQFFDWRPEYSTFGDHVYGTAQWLFSDTLALMGTAIWDLDADEIARSSAGIQISHSPVLSTFIEYRYLNASENELLDVGWEYLITPKYRLALVPSYDLRAEDFRSLTASLRRRLPDVDLIVEVTYDQILDETSVSASLGRTTF